MRSHAHEIGDILVIRFEEKLVPALLRGYEDDLDDTTPLYCSLHASGRKQRSWRQQEIRVQPKDIVGTRPYSEYDVKAAIFKEKTDDKREHCRRYRLPIAPLDPFEQDMYHQGEQIEGRLLSCAVLVTDDLTDEERALRWMSPPHTEQPISSLNILSAIVYNPTTQNISWIARHKKDYV